MKGHNTSEIELGKTGLKIQRGIVSKHSKNVDLSILYCIHKITNVYEGYTKYWSICMQYL